MVHHSFSLQYHHKKSKHLYHLWQWFPTFITIQTPSLKVPNSERQPNYSSHYSPFFYFQTQLNLQYVSSCVRCLKSHFPFQRNSKGYCTSMKTYKVQFQSFLTTALDEGEWSASWPAALLPSPHYTSNRRMGGLQSLFEILQNTEVSCGCWDLNPTTLSPWLNYIY